MIEAALDAMTMIWKNSGSCEENANKKAESPPWSPGEQTLFRDLLRRLIGFNPEENRSPIEQLIISRITLSMLKSCHSHDQKVKPRWQETSTAVPYWCVRILGGHAKELEPGTSLWYPVTEQETVDTNRNTGNSIQNKKHPFCSEDSQALP